MTALRTIIVLVMHGVPPSDFPKEEAREYFRLHGEQDADHSHTHSSSGPHSESHHRYQQLDRKMRRWPRNAENDPYHAGSERLAEELRRASGLEVVLAFNEFCGPSVDEVLDRAAALGAEKVIAITPMMTSGGGHSEVDIPRAIERAAARNPHIRFTYAWPFRDEEIAGFLAAQIGRFL